MKRRTIQLCLWSILFADLVSADLIITSTPLAGYITDASGSQLWPIWGVPGSFSFGNLVSLPKDVSQIRLAPGQKYALAGLGQSATGILHLKSGGIDHIAPIDGAMSSPDWVAFSPGAGSALLFSASAHRLQVLKGLPDAPQVGSDLDSSTLPETPALGTVSDDGSLVILASTTSAYRLSPDGLAQLVLSAGGIQSLTVLRNGVDVAISDSATGTLYMVRNAATQARLEPLASGLDWIGNVFPSANGRTLFATQPGTSVVSSIDLSNGEVRSSPSSAAPAGLTPLRNGDTFLISANSQQPGWIFYLDGDQGRVVFIPPAQAADENSTKGDPQ